MTRKHAPRVLLVAAALAGLTGCSSTPAAPLAPPKEVVYMAETAEWSVVTGEPGAEVPKAIPIVTMLGGTRHEGLLLAPGTRGYVRTLPNGIREGEYQQTEIVLPIVIESKGKAWRLVMTERLFPSGTVENAVREPFVMDVAVDPPGPENTVYRTVYGEGVRAD
jgi:hypothetical protein